MNDLLLRIELILEFCKTKKEYQDFISIMESMVAEAKKIMQKNNSKKLVQYNKYFDELIEDDPKADLFLVEKLGLRASTKKRRQKALNEIRKRKKILNDDEHYIVMEKINEETVTNALKGKANISLIEELNSLVLNYERSGK